MSRTLTREVTIARRAYRLDPDRVERMMNGILPEPILRHYVVVDQRRYPPKQVIAEITGLDRADFKRTRRAASS